MIKETTETKRQIEPTILVIFGATGSLSTHHLLPALFHLFGHGLMPQKFSVVGFARSEFSHAMFRERIHPEIQKRSSAALDSKTWTAFAKKISYEHGNFTDDASFAKLERAVHGLEARGHSCANRLFYFATLPSHYETISHQLKKSGLLVGCGLHDRQTRVIIEKPFGQDLKSARALDRTLKKYFAEDQIYRIDHYLGKETVQNILTVRFANSIFEPIWNRNYIDHVQISALEENGIGNRGAFYEQTGAIRDFLQNHLIQLLALTAMEPPVNLSTAAIRDERTKVIKAIKSPTTTSLRTGLVLGQYQAYRHEPNVSPKSKVETYVALKLEIANPRWADVPFYLRTGKRLAKKTTEISIYFKPALPDLFHDEVLRPNILTFQIQPNEGIFLELTAKYPGFGIRLHPVRMELGYHSAFKDEIPEAYERLLLDFMEGDQRLFASSEEIEHSWWLVDAITQYQNRTAKFKLPTYPEDSWGPKETEQLMHKDKRQWHTV